MLDTAATISGRGSLSAFGLYRQTDNETTAGAGVDFLWRLNERVHGFARGEYQRKRDRHTREVESALQALGGVRVNF